MRAANLFVISELIYNISSHHSPKWKKTTAAGTYWKHLHLKQQHNTRCLTESINSSNTYFLKGAVTVAEFLQKKVCFYY